MNATILLCPPDFFRIAYEINPWMSRERDAVQSIANDQWAILRKTLEACGARVEVMVPQPGLPDMVFTANAGLVVGHQFINSRFYHHERQGESPFFEAWFRQHGFEVIQPPSGLSFEGEGDALFHGDTMFCGYRFRSDIRAHRFLSEWLGCLVVSLELVDGRWYHLDTCFCSLNAETAMWYPGAFDEYSQKAVRHNVRDLITVHESEALRFCCNSIVLGKNVILPDGCPRLEFELKERGFTPHPIPMSEFLKSGGACKCLTLFIPQREALVQSRSKAA